MDKEFSSKMKRFRELSQKFLKKEDDIIPHHTYTHIKGDSFISGGYSSQMYAYGNVTVSERDEWNKLSKSERIIGKAEQYAVLHNEYKEWWELNRFFYSFFEDNDNKE